MNQLVVLGLLCVWNSVRGAQVQREEDDGKLRCYVCNPQDDFHCSPQDLWGNLTKCQDGVKVCYKSWTVEADPKTQRRCGKVSDTPDTDGQCQERLKVNNKAIVCKCDSTGCNGVEGMTVTQATSVYAAAAVVTSLFCPLLLLHPT